jgi:uncharacterized protein YdeI (YjbR/CyaY-like superfamily)
VIFSVAVKTFRARIKLLEGALGWHVVDIPFDVKKVFSAAGRVPVIGTVNGFPFRTSLFPRKNGKYYLMLNKKVQKGAKASIGDSISVVIELDTKKRTIGTPVILKQAFLEDDNLLKYFEGFSYLVRKWMGEYVATPKSPATRARRVEQMAATLMEMRDGEIEPPPFLQAEFAHNPKAKNGWEKMTASHKRSHLWGILYYKSPESRKKRMQKAIDMMVKYAEKPLK